MKVKSSAQGHIIVFYKVIYGCRGWTCDVLDVCGHVLCVDAEEDDRNAKKIKITLWSDNHRSVTFWLLIGAGAEWLMTRSRVWPLLCVETSCCCRPRHASTQKTLLRTWMFLNLDNELFNEDNSVWCFAGLGRRSYISERVIWLRGLVYEKYQYRGFHLKS